LLVDRAITDADELERLASLLGASANTTVGWVDTSPALANPDRLR